MNLTNYFILILSDKSEYTQDKIRIVKLEETIVTTGKKV